jgi:hypothetical protein
MTMGGASYVERDLALSVPGGEFFHRAGGLLERVRVVDGHAERSCLEQLSEAP